ncbi:MAG: hypothetical protein ACRC3H_20920 [Lachnospiraceae bacterium]
MECQTLRKGEGLASQRYYLPMENHIAALLEKGSSMVWNVLNHVPVGTILISTVFGTIKVMCNLCLIKMAHSRWCIVKAS